MSRRLKPQWYQILVALAAAPRHGSAIASEVWDLSEGRIRLWPTTLYGSLDEMVAKGLIETMEGDLHPEGESERKRYYQLSSTGRRVLAEESRWHRSIAELATKRLRIARKGAK